MFVLNGCSHTSIVHGVNTPLVPLAQRSPRRWRAPDAADSRWSFVLDALTRYNYLGWITFLNDQGEADGFQRIEYEKTIYCPLHLEHASAADFFGKVAPAVY